MGLDIIEFRTEPHRTEIRSGHAFGVVLTAQWNPFSGGGTEDVTLEVADAQAQITPKTIPITVPATGDVVTMKFHITLTTTAGTITRIAAQGQSDNAAFFIHVTV